MLFTFVVVVSDHEGLARLITLLLVLRDTQLKTTLCTAVCKITPVSERRSTKLLRISQISHLVGQNLAYHNPCCGSIPEETCPVNKRE